MAIEYEHKYLLKGKPDFVFSDDELTSQYVLHFHGVAYIEQFYMAIDRERNYVHRARCTKTHPTSTMARYEECHKIGKGKDTEEIEYHIFDNIYDQLKKHCAIGSVVNKLRRFGVDRAGLHWDIDEYSTGEWIAELENPPDQYEVPFKDAINVTDDFNYKNVSIALNGFPKS